MSSQKQKLENPTKEAIANVTHSSQLEMQSEGTVFDETISSYKTLLSRVEHTMVGLLKRELQHVMKDYFKKFVLRLFFYSASANIIETIGLIL